MGIVRASDDSCNNAGGHRHAAQRPSCTPSGPAIRRPAHGPIHAPSCRRLPPAHTAPRATPAAGQLSRAGTTMLVRAWTRAESLPGRATSPAVGAPPLAPKAGVRRMGCGDVCLLNDEGYRAIKGSSRPPLINLTGLTRGIYAASDVLMAGCPGHGRRLERARTTLARPRSTA